MSDEKKLLTPEMEAKVEATQRRGRWLIYGTMLVVGIAASVAPIPWPLLVVVGLLWSCRLALQGLAPLMVGLMKAAERAGYGEDK